MKRFPIMAVLFVFLVAAGSALAQTADQQEDKDKNRRYLYEWKDDKGTVYITDDLGDVPEKYREKVKKTVERPGTESKSAERETKIKPAAPSAESPGENDEKAKKAEWRLRLLDWKERLADAEKRYRALEDERSSIIMRWGVTANAPPAYRTRAAELEDEMKQVQTEIDEARNMINVVIPEEARKANVPPGWLRE